MPLFDTPYHLYMNSCKDRIAVKRDDTDDRMTDILKPLMRNVIRLLKSFFGLEGRVYYI